MATLTLAMGMTDPERAARAVAAVAEGYFPGAGEDAEMRGDAGLAELMDMLAPTDLSVVVARVALMVQGCDATAAVIGLTLRALHDAGVAAERWPTDQVITEVLRYNPPLRLMRRVAPRNTSFQGTRIAAGDAVLCSIEAGNRDPAVFGNADTFDPLRPSRPSLTFGFGLRPCPGSEHALMLAGGVVEAVRAGCVLPTAGAVEYEGGGLRIPRRVFAILR